LESGFEPAYGEVASHIVHDGVLLISWSQPTGEVTTDLSKLEHRYYDDESRNKKLLDTYFRIDADWKTAALDAATGEVLWENTEPSASINFLANKRNHNGITGAAGDGVYVTLTMMGHVFAYDVKTGKTLWEFTLDDWNSRAEEVKQKSLANELITSLRAGPFGHKRSGAVVADGIVVLPDLSDGLLGLRVKDGSEVWRTADRLHSQATPRPVHLGSKTWLLCNNASGGVGQVHLIDPENGETRWSYETGANPGALILGDDVVMLNPHPKTKKDALFAAYRITEEGLEQLWRFEDAERNRIQIRPDFGAHRKGVIRDGLLYIKLGAGKGVKARMAVVDVKSGKELASVKDPRLGANAGQPFLAEDKLYLQRNSAHSGGKAGLYVYQLEEGGGLTYLGDVMYAGLGVRQMTSYEYPIETPYADGLVFLRGKKQMAAMDLRVVEAPMAKLQFEGLWAGFHRPVDAILIADAKGKVGRGRLDSPPRKELGVVGTSANRNSGWTPLDFPEPITFGAALETPVEFGFVAFSAPGRLEMEAAADGQWNGTWYRDYPGWDKTVKREGEIHSSSEGGYERRGWPTGWLKDRPVTFFSDLPDGQERVFLQLRGLTPGEPGGRGPKNMTLCLDHNGHSVKSAIAGGFTFNQSYHEVDASGLEVDEKGIRGTALVYLNSDTWGPADYQNGGSLAGRLELNVRFKEPNKKGIYPIRGEWKAEWGIQHTRSGAVTSKVTSN
jgi:outer membrane protein assembly factor BamB